MKKNGKTTTLKAVDSAGAEEKVREWILREKPSEKEMIGDFDPEVTFREVAERMMKGEDFYVICSCGESVQRELAFGRLAEVFGTNYEFWYRTWLDGKPPKSLNPREPKRMLGRCRLVTRIA